MNSFIVYFYTFNKLLIVLNKKSELIYLHCQYKFFLYKYLIMYYYINKSV